MKQIWIPRIGGPEVLELRGTSQPKPQPNEVRIAVKAAGINFADIMARLGLYPDAPKLPAVIGYEVSGIVDSVGSDVSHLKEGDRVASLTRFGGYSEAICVPASNVMVLPENLSFEKAAAIPVNYLTAWIMLVHLGNVKVGDKVLIHAAAGGVGIAATQIAKWLGATIFGTASRSKHERLKNMGVHHCIDYHSQDFEKEIKELTNGTGVDIALDAVGGNSFKKSYRSLSSLGRLYLFGASSLGSGKTRNLFNVVMGLAQMPSFKPINLMNDNRGVHGVNMGHLWNKLDLLQSILKEIVNLVSQGILDPHVDKTFPFEEAGAAHAYIQDRKNFGKVMLIP